MEKQNAEQVLRKIFKKYIWHLVGMVLLTAFSSAISSVSPVFYGKIIDEAIPDKDINKLFLCVGVVVGLPLVNTFLSFLSSKIMFIFSTGCEKQAKMYFFKQMLYMNYPSFSKMGASKFATVLNRNIA